LTAFSLLSAATWTEKKKPDSKADASWIQPVVYFVVVSQLALDSVFGFGLRSCNRPSSGSAWSTTLSLPSLLVKDTPILTQRSFLSLPDAGTTV
jgi:hypothetical protein